MNETLDAKKNIGFILLVLSLAALFILIIMHKQEAAVPEICGNSICNPGEDAATCLQDCRIVPAPLKNSLCGNHRCDQLETYHSCPDDCPSGGRDGYCDKVSDQICDTDCAPQDDADCLKILKAVCGDNSCNEQENCVICPKDCPCSQGEYCSRVQNRCVLPECGNEWCEPYEHPGNCCLDCDCPELQSCNLENQRCEYPGMQITDEDAEDIAVSFFQNKSRQINTILKVSTTTYQSQVIKRVVVALEDDKEERVHAIGIYADGKVEELLIH